MATKGIVLLKADKSIEERAKREGLGVRVAGKGADIAPLRNGRLPFAKTLYLGEGTKPPWDLLPAAWHFLERWDAAVPLWRYGVTAEDAGTKGERARTKEIVRDLRVLLHAVELLFVRDNADGRALVEAWGEEIENLKSKIENPDQRLAFLRAMYRVKPRVCVLPRSWLAEVQARSKQDARAAKLKKRRTPLVRVEVLPGRFVQCHQGDEELVKKRFAGSGRRRGGRRG
jgi:hypothetical protein